MSVTIHLSADEVARVKQATNLENEAEAVSKVVREFLVRDRATHSAGISSRKEPLLTLRLRDSAIGQIIDGLTCRKEAYERTAEYFETGKCDGEIEEVTDADEARNLAAIYERILDDIVGQYRIRQ